MKELPYCIDSSSRLLRIHNLHNHAFCLYHTRGSDESHVAHGVFGVVTIDAMTAFDGDAIECEGYGTVGGINCNNTFHGTSVVRNAPINIARMPMATNRLISTAPAKESPMALTTKMPNGTIDTIVFFSIAATKLRTFCRVGNTLCIVNAYQ